MLTCKGGRPLPRGRGRPSNMGWAAPRELRGLRGAGLRAGGGEGAGGGVGGTKGGVEGAPFIGREGRRAGHERQVQFEGPEKQGHAPAPRGAAAGMEMWDVSWGQGSSNSLAIKEGEFVQAPRAAGWQR